MSANDLRVADAISQHAWAIASYIRETTTDIAEQKRIAKNVSKIILMCLEHTEVSTMADGASVA